MSRLAFGPSEFCVNGLIGAKLVAHALDTNEEVRNTPYALYDKGHLINDVVTLVEGITDTRDPLGKGLVGVAPRHLVDRATLILKV